MNEICPVCGYNKMMRPPSNFYICPCCGTGFEEDDFEVTHEELRDKWKANGMKWFSRYSLPPAGWNPTIQLLNTTRQASTSMPSLDLL